MRFFKSLFYYLDYYFHKFYYHLRPCSKIGISGNTDLRLIVSLTSYPPRIKDSYYCLKSLLTQSLKPDKVILWLSAEEFCNKEADLPIKIKRLKKRGLTIAWCNNLYSYKKLIPALENYSDATIVTADDDVYYSKNWLKDLVANYDKDAKEVVCYRAAKIYIDDGKIEREYVSKGSLYRRPTFLHQQTGVGGVLYPPNCFYKDVTNDKKFIELADKNDDLWFWIMCVLGGYKIKIINNNSFKLYYIGNTQRVSLTQINDNGKKLYYIQLKQLINEYPEVYRILLEEYNDVKKN